MESFTSEENYNFDLRSSNSSHCVEEISHSSLSFKTTMSLDYPSLSRRSSATTFYSLSSPNASFLRFFSNSIDLVKPCAVLKRRRSVHFPINMEMTSKRASERKFSSVVEMTEVNSCETSITSSFTKEISTQTCPEIVSSLMNIPSFIPNRSNKEGAELKISENDFANLNMADSIIKMEKLSRVIAEKMIGSPYKKASEFGEDVSICLADSVSKSDLKMKVVNTSYRYDFDLDTIKLSYLEKLKDVVNFSYVDSDITPDALSYLEKMKLVAGLYRNSFDLAEGMKICKTSCKVGSLLKLSILEKKPDLSEANCENPESVISSLDSFELTDLFLELVRKKANNYHKNRHQPKTIDGILMKIVNDYVDACTAMNIINNEEFSLCGRMKMGEPSQVENVAICAQPCKTKFFWMKTISSSIQKIFNKAKNEKLV